MMSARPTFAADKARDAHRANTRAARSNDDNALDKQLAARLADGLREIALTLDETQQASLIAFVRLLKKWNKTYNLTAIDAPDKMLALHVFDTLAVIPHLDRALDMRAQKTERRSAPALAPHAPPDKTNASEASTHIAADILDVGAGAGIPGIILAIARPLWRLTLIDAVHKKTAFCTQAIAELQLKNARALHGRIESFVPSEPPTTFDVIISRAFSSLAPFVTGSRHVLSPTGFFAAMKGVNPEDELASLPSNTRIIDNIVVTPPFLHDAQRRFILMETTHD